MNQRILRGDHGAVNFFYVKIGKVQVRYRKILPLRYRNGTVLVVGHAEDIERFGAQVPNFEGRVTTHRRVRHFDEMTHTHCN